MSCSQFIEHDDEDKSDTLVVIVNGDGTVSVDRETLERVLQQQCRAAVSFIKLEDSNEPDSQSGKATTDLNDAPSEDKEAFCNKVNLVVEGYYPPPPVSMASKNNGSADSVVSSTVATPPLPQSSSDFLDLLSEGLEIPVPNIQASSNEDTLKLKEDDWVHFDHCYTNIYGCGKSSPPPSKAKNVVVQDSEEATYETIKVGQGETAPQGNSAPIQSNSINESELGEKRDEFDTESQIHDSRNESAKSKRKSIPLSSAPKSENSDEKSVLPKKNSVDNAKNLVNSAREKRAFHILSKVKRRNTPKCESVEQPVERIVTEDEVDGVKVFKPTRNDKKSVRPFVFSKDGGKSILLPRSQLIQTKLNFSKKEENESVASPGPTKSLAVSKEKLEGHVIRPDASVQKNRPCSISETDESSKNIKKETPRKQPPPVTPETFGPALFSTPDIIRKINNDDTAKEGDKFTTPSDSIVDETADIEKRMSAIENGEAILDRIHMQFEMQNKQRYSSLSDDDRLLSDLENTDDESNQKESEISTSLNETKKLESPESNSELSSRKSSNVDKSENSDKDDVDYEDDPNKLWCVCNKPHGNRFMICCDACDNWYHGSCVGVTRPMGEKMELNGTEWLCPSCRKEKFAKEREMKLKLATRSIANRTSGKQSMSNSLNLSTSDTSLTVPVNSGERVTNQVTAVRRKSSSQPIKITQSQLCIECKEKEIMPNAIYCSNACIMRLVDTFLSSNSSSSDLSPDEQKICVVDKKRGHRITGMRAPSVANLKEWLMEHPSYEVIRPSALPISRPLPAVKEVLDKPVQKPIEPMKSSHPISKDIQNVATKTKLSLKFKDNDASFEGNPQTSIRQFFGSKSNNANPSKIKKLDDGSGNILIREGNVLRTVSTAASKKEAELKMKEKQRQIKLIPVQSYVKQGEEPKPVHSIVRKVVIPTPTVDKEKKRKTEVPIKEKPPASKKIEMKKQDSKKSPEEVGDASEQPTPVVAKGPEPVRPKLKKSLSDLFLSRSKDIIDLTVPETDLIALATKVEEELFNYFKDTGPKYKNKYRSLVFNLRDQKNNLFRRVADKSLTPHELVRLTPEELASTELAQWRQREAKHEIDMIKKTELENLSQTKILVVKTHKGELEIEPSSLPPSKSDIVVPDLQPDEFPVEKDRGKTYTSSALNKDRGKNSVLIKDKTSSKDDGDKKDRRKKSDHRDKERHKSRKHRHRSSERDHHRSRSRRRSKSGEKDGHKGSTAEKSSSHRSRSSDKGHSSSRSTDKDRHQSRGKRKRSRSRSRRKHRSSERKDGIAALSAATAVQSNDIVENNAESDKLSTTAVETEKPTEDEEKIAADLLSSYNAVDVDLSDMEPTSTVTIKTPPYAHSPESPTYVWKGVLNVPEAAKVLTTLKEVSGNCEDLDEDLPPILEGVGRLKPEVMWRYISEVKKSGHEILVLRFEVQDEVEQTNYLSVYSHLSMKNRMGVIGCSCPSIKDFYVMTLPSHSPIPQILLPLNGPGFEDNRSHMLLAIIVRTRRKKYSSGVSLPHSSSRTSRRTNVENGIPTLPPVVTPVVDNDSFTPPHSPTSVFVNNAVTAPIILDNDEDEPYSPGGDDEEPYSPSALDEDHSSKSSDVERELEEINRKIAEEKKKIKEFESVGSSVPKESAKECIELYSPTEHFPGETEAPSVQLPDDLQQLLNSFSKKSSEPASVILQTDPIISAYKSHKSHKSGEVEDVPTDGAFSSPEVGGDRVLGGAGTVASLPPDAAAAAIDESKLSRDPRRKQATESQSAQVYQPPPPGMEDEFSASGRSADATITTTTAAESAMISMNVADPAYAVSLQVTPFSYTAAAAAAAVAPVPQYPPPMLPAHPQMFMTATQVFPQPGTLPYVPMPAAQMYVPPAVLHHDPSMIPLPMDGGDQLNSLKRKAVDDIDNDDDKDRSDARKFDSKARKSPAYYSADAKSRRSDSRSPTRHKGSSGYDSHRRDYQRDDPDYGSSGGSSSGHSRYPHKHGKSYSSRRSGYWKGGNDYSSGHRKYSDRSRRSSRSSSREKSSRRYDTTKSS